MSRIIAIDPGQSCGYAWTDNGTIDVKRSGVWDLGQFTQPGQRFSKYAGKLGSCVRAEYLVYETAPGLRGQALRWHAGYLANAQRWAYENDAQFIGCNVATLKKFATGHGDATKGDMLESFLHNYAKNQWWLADEPNDRIDALWLLVWGVVQIAAMETTPRGTDCTT